MPKIIGGVAAIVAGVFVTPFSPQAGLALIGLGASLVLGEVSRALAGKPKTFSFLQDLSWRTVSIQQPAPPWRIIYGSVRTGGVYSFRHLTGTNDEFLHLILTLAGHEVNSIGNVYFDGVEVPLDGSGDATGTFAGYVHVIKHTGDPTDSSQPFADLQTAAPTVWTANHLQRGRAKVWVRLKWNADLFPHDVPNITFDVQGKKVYDPRTSTTIYSNLGALVLNDYLTDSDLGFGADYSTKVDETTLIAAANKCDEAVSLKAGGDEDRYTTNGIFDTSEQPGDVLNQMSAAMAGRTVYAGGKWFIHAGSYLTPAVTITEGDLRGPIKVRTRLSQREMHNGVKGIFTSASNNWQPSDFPSVDGSSYLTEDGNVRRWLDIILPFTTSVATAQRLGKIELERARQQETAELYCYLGMYKIQPPEVVQFTYSPFSWTNKTFEVVGNTLDTFQDDEGAPALGVILRLRATESSVFSWTPATDEKDENTPPALTLPDTMTVQPPTSLALASSASTALLRQDGVRISRIKATWTAPTDQFVISGGRIIFEYKTNAGSTWLPAGETVGVATEHYIAGVDDGVAYDVRCWAVNAAGVASSIASVTNHTVTGVTMVSANTSYRPLTNPLTATDAGATATITIAAFTMRSAGVNLSINPSSLTGLSFDTLYYVYYTDAEFDGGSVTFAAATAKTDALNGADRFFVGSITTPADGRGDTVGNNDGGAGAQFGLTVLLETRSAAKTSGGNGVVANEANAADADPTTYGTAQVTGNSATNFATLATKVDPNESQLPIQTKTIELNLDFEIPTNSVVGTGDVAVCEYTTDGSTWNTISGFSYAPGVTASRRIATQTISANSIINLCGVRIFTGTDSNHTSGTVIARVYRGWVAGLA